MRAVLKMAIVMVNMMAVVIDVETKEAQNGNVIAPEELKQNWLS